MGVGFDADRWSALTIEVTHKGVEDWQIDGKSSSVELLLSRIRRVWYEENQPLPTRDLTWIAGILTHC